MATEQKSIIAAVLSLVIPGLGQLYKGHFILGLLWFLVLGGGYFFSLASTGMLGVGLIALILHIICIVQAYRMP